MTSSSCAARPLLIALQLGLPLRAARKQRGLTQAEVGARLGLSQNRVSHLEAHADELSVKQLLTWCAVVGLELSLAQRLAERFRTGSVEAFDLLSAIGRDCVGALRGMPAGSSVGAAGACRQVTHQWPTAHK